MAELMNLENCEVKMQSGRPITATPLFVEDCRVISTKSLTEPIGPGGATADITRSCETCGHIEQTKISIVQTRQGPRFVCPCGAAVMKLYQPPGLNDWRCRNCLGLVYRDQYRKPSALIRAFQAHQQRELRLFG